MWFGMEVDRVDVGVSVNQTDVVVGYAELDEVMAGMDVARLSWDTHCESQLDGRKVIDVDRGRMTLREANGCKVVAESEYQACDGSKAIVL